MTRKGPVPKRPEERRRTNVYVGEERLKVPPTLRVKQPPLPKDFDFTINARDWYASLAQSGQAVYYELSDWQMAIYIAIQMSLSTRKIKASLVGNVLKGMSDLLVSEGARRHARFTIERDTPDSEKEAAGVATVAEYKRKLGAG